MSGFCGQFNRDGRPATTEDIDPAMEALSHHGRDGRGVWAGGPVAFGHQMLHVTPESIGETLPCYQSQPGLAITGDFRLDNRAELQDKLAVPRELRATMPDSALILLAYERWGAACMDHLLGDFAFAVWDEAARHLFCARDFIGAKPFYYHATGDGFYFASDITGLLAFPAVSDELDLRYVRSLLEFFTFYHPEHSYLKDVRKLQPGHTLTVSDEGTQYRRYWSPEGVAEVRYSRDEEYIDHLRALLGEVVNIRLRSAFPIGSHLSGGLDSSSIAVLAARALRERGETLHGFSWSPPPAPDDFPLTDERAMVQAVCEAESIIPIYTPLRPEDVLATLMQDITRHPLHSLRVEATTSRIASAMGKRVILSGWGGDEGIAFNGRGYFADLLRRGHWITMTRELALRTRLHEDSFWGSFRSRAVLPLLPDGLVLRLRPDLLNFPRKPLPLEFLQPAFAARLAEAESYPVELWRERPGARKFQIGLFNDGHLTHRLESWANLGGYRAIEYRYPLLDRRLVDFSLGIPDRFFHYQGWKRYLFRQTTTDLLPQEVQWNKYKGEPAARRFTGPIINEADRMLPSALENRRGSIQRAGYIEEDVFLTGIRQKANNPDKPTEAYWVIWLALLD